MRIASRTGSSVLTTKSETEIAASVDDDDLTRVDRAGTDTAVSTEASATPSTAASAEAPEPAPAPRATATQTAQTTPAPQPTPDRAPTPDRDTDAARTDLPNTASFLPLLAVIGIGSLVGSRWLRRSRRV